MKCARFDSLRSTLEHICKQVAYLQPLINFCSQPSFLRVLLRRLYRTAYPEDEETLVKFSATGLCILAMTRSDLLRQHVYRLFYRVQGQDSSFCSLNH